MGGPNCEAIYEEISTTDLVPGDIIVIPRIGFEVPCDIALLCGTCVVNESMLTGNHEYLMILWKTTFWNYRYLIKFLIVDFFLGESVPVLKTALPNINLLYNEREDANHTLFSGTKVLQARYFSDRKVHGVVLRTGYLTAKGSLVRSILYPPPADFRFDKDTYRFIWILAAVATSGSIYTAVSKVSKIILYLSFKFK